MEHTSEEKQSPFAVRPNERAIINHPKHKPKQGILTYNIENGIFNEEHFMYLKRVNEYRFITSKQLYEVLLYEGYSVKSQQKVADKLEYMFNSGVLRRVNFESDVGEGKFKAYAVGSFGTPLLKARSVRLTSSPADLALLPNKIKRVLATNQVFISVREGLDALCFYPLFKSDEVSHAIVKPSLSLKCNDKSYIVDVVRTFDGWEADFKWKFERYRKVYKSIDFKKHDLTSSPTLVLVGENSDHVKGLEVIVNDVMSSKMSFLKELFGGDKHIDIKYYKDSDFRYVSDCFK
jgi:hypothetical protein